MRIPLASASVSSLLLWGTCNAALEVASGDAGRPPADLGAPALDALPDGAGQCGYRPQDFTSIKVTEASGKTIECATARGPQPYLLDVVGRLADGGGAGRLLVHTCHTTGCVSQPIALTADSTRCAFDPRAYAGIVARVRVWIDVPWGCVAYLLVTEADTWDGTPTPGPFGNGALLIAIGDGSYVTPPDWPASLIQVNRVASHCPATTTVCGDPTPTFSDYLMRFTEDGSTTDVPMSDVSWRTTKPGVLCNLRSFETGWCDDYFNYSWVVLAHHDVGG
jgi:hypothetical protein